MLRVRVTICGDDMPVVTHGVVLLDESMHSGKNIQKGHIVLGSHSFGYALGLGLGFRIRVTI